MKTWDIKKTLQLQLSEAKIYIIFTGPDRMLSAIELSKTTSKLLQIFSGKPQLYIYIPCQDQEQQQQHITLYAKKKEKKYQPLCACVSGQLTWTR